MAIKDWKKEEGWESPDFYNIRFIKGNNEIILSNINGDDTKSVNWYVGIYKNDDPLSEERFVGKSQAIAYAKKYMEKN